MVSVVILTHQEEEKEIGRCLSSVGWADEVLTISEVDKPLAGDFAAKRNWGLAKAKGEWVLFVDADEVVSEALAKEIKEKTIKSDSQGYFLRRQDYFMGRWLRFGETGSVHLLRLAKKGTGKWKRKVHEYWDVKNAGELKNPLQHFAHQTIRSFIQKNNLYSDIDAKEFKKFSYLDLFKPTGKFIENYFFRLGFLDGLPGLAMAVMMSVYSLTVRVKQYELTSHS